jgi:hypothetical protein
VYDRWDHHSKLALLHQEWACQERWVDCGAATLARPAAYWGAAALARSEAALARMEGLAHQENCLTADLVSGLYLVSVEPNMAPTQADQEEPADRDGCIHKDAEVDLAALDRCHGRPGYAHVRGGTNSALYPDRIS